MTTTLTTSRTYAGESDLQAICDLLNLCDTVHTLDDNYSVDDLRLEFAHPRLDTARDLRLWEDGDGRLVGFGQLWIVEQAPDSQVADGFLYMRIHPEWHGPLDDEVIAWGEERMREIGVERGRPALLRAGAVDHYTDLREALERNGYTINRYFFTMERPLDLPIEERPLPEGYTLRHVEEEADYARWVEAFNQSFIDHWNHHPTTLDEHMHWINNDPHYRKDQDLLAVTADGTVAAFCFCIINPDENARNNRQAGWIATLGTRRGYRNIGLGRAMLLAGLRVLKQNSMTTARLGVDAENPSGALRLYESVGFVRIQTRVSYARELA
ncbi:MAG: hypothetical protein OHK0022_43670 [Roseiflexaceae bacterium]